jgi:hypothetical protein
MQPTAARAFRSTEELEIINFWSPIQCPALLNFRDRTPKRTVRGAIELKRNWYVCILDIIKTTVTFSPPYTSIEIKKNESSPTPKLVAMVAMELRLRV